MGYWTIYNLGIILLVFSVFSLMIPFSQTASAIASDGTVGLEQKISDIEGDFTGILDFEDRFGNAIASMGDINNDGIEDIAVGAIWDDDGGYAMGAVWILFLDTNGIVQSHQKISKTAGNFTGTPMYGSFGSSLANIGDFDNNGVNDLAVGAITDDDGITYFHQADRGAVWILFLNSDGTVKSQQKISDIAGNLTPNNTGGLLDPEDYFGVSVANIGDLNNDGVNDLAVGASGWGPYSYINQEVWILFMNANGTVSSHQVISDTAGNLTPNNTGGLLAANDRFGRSVAGIGDLNKDGILDIAVGASRDDDGGTNTGAIWILFLNNNGTVQSHQKISDTVGGSLIGKLADGIEFGISVAGISDINNDGKNDIVVGSRLAGRGAVWILFMDNNGTVLSHQKIAQGVGGFTGPLPSTDQFGISVAGIGNLNNYGEEDLAVGAWLDNDGGQDRGAVWILFEELIEEPIEGPDLSITKQAVNTPWPAGQFTFEIIVTNNGTASITSGLIIMEDVLPNNLQVSTVTQAGSLWNCSVTGANPPATVTCTWPASIQTVPVGPFPPITITGTILFDTTVRNCASVEGTNDDGSPFLEVNMNNNESCVKLQVVVAESCLPPPSDMVAWWPLDEPTGTTAADISGNGNDGTHVNIPVPVAGKVAGALKFGGQDEFVLVSDNPSLNFGSANGTSGDFAIDAWIFLDTFTAGESPIVSKWDGTNGYYFFILDGDLGLVLADGVGPPYFTEYYSPVGPLIPTAQWIHVAVSVDRDKPNGLLFYVDGASHGPPLDPTGRMGSLVNTEHLHIGNNIISPFGNTPQSIVGIIDEVEIYNKTLSDSEIGDIHDPGKCKGAEGPLAPTPTPTAAPTAAPTQPKAEKVPGWIKNTAKWWSDGQIEDADFVGGIQYMIKEKIIDIPDLPEQASVTAEEHVPNWIQNNAGWWADGLISEDDFVAGIKWLVENGIIKV